MKPMTIQKGTLYNIMIFTICFLLPFMIITLMPIELAIGDVSQGYNEYRGGAYRVSVKTDSGYDGNNMRWYLEEGKSMILTSASSTDAMLNAPEGSADRLPNIEFWQGDVYPCDSNGNYVNPNTDVPYSYFKVTPINDAEGNVEKVIVEYSVNYAVGVGARTMSRVARYSTPVDCNLFYKKSCSVNCNYEISDIFTVPDYKVIATDTKANVEFDINFMLVEPSSNAVNLNGIDYYPKAWHGIYDAKIIDIRMGFINYVSDDADFVTGLPDDQQDVLQSMSQDPEATEFDKTGFNNGLADFLGGGRTFGTIKSQVLKVDHYLSTLVTQSVSGSTQGSLNPVDATGSLMPTVSYNKTLPVTQSTNFNAPAAVTVKTNMFLRPQIEIYKTDVTYETVQIHNTLNTWYEDNRQTKLITYESGATCLDVYYFAKIVFETRNVKILTIAELESTNLVENIDALQTGENGPIEFTNLFNQDGFGNLQGVLSSTQFQWWAGLFDFLGLGTMINGIIGLIIVIIVVIIVVWILMKFLRRGKAKKVIEKTVYIPTTPQTNIVDGRKNYFKSFLDAKLYAKRSRKSSTDTRRELF